MKHIASLFLAISMLLALVVSSYCEAQSLDEEITEIVNIERTNLSPDINLRHDLFDTFIGKSKKLCDGKCE